MTDTRRNLLSLYGSALLNGVYCLFLAVMAIYHRTFWYGSFSFYYLCLCLIRVFLVCRTDSFTTGTRLHREWIRYLICSIILLIMNLALAIIVFFMVYWGRTFYHHQITTITMAVFTFAALSLAITRLTHLRKTKSPVRQATILIRLVSGCVSLLTLESTMLTTFQQESSNPLTAKLLLSISGGVICLGSIVLSIGMICHGLKELKHEKEI